MVLENVKEISKTGSTIYGFSWFHTQSSSAFSETWVWPAPEACFRGMSSKTLYWKRAQAQGSSDGIRKNKEISETAATVCEFRLFRVQASSAFSEMWVWPAREACFRGMNSRTLYRKRAQARVTGTEGTGAGTEGKIQKSAKARKPDLQIYL